MCFAFWIKLQIDINAKSLRINHFFCFQILQFRISHITYDAFFFFFYTKKSVIIFRGKIGDMFCVNSEMFIYFCGPKFWEKFLLQISEEIMRFFGYNLWKQNRTLENLRNLACSSIFIENFFAKKNMDMGKTWDNPDNLPQLYKHFEQNCPEFPCNAPYHCGRFGNSTHNYIIYACQLLENLCIRDEGPCPLPVPKCDAPETTTFPSKLRVNKLYIFLPKNNF